MNFIVIFIKHILPPPSRGAKSRCRLHGDIPDRDDSMMPFFFQDEILSYSEKMTLKLDDLVNLIVHNVTWIEGRKAVPDKALLTHHEHAELAEAFKMNSYGLSYKDIQKETETFGKLAVTYDLISNRKQNIPFLPQIKS